MSYRYYRRDVPRRQPEPRTTYSQTPRGSSYSGYPLRDEIMDGRTCARRNGHSSDSDTGYDRMTTSRARPGSSWAHRMPPEARPEQRRFHGQPPNSRPQKPSSRSKDSRDWSPRRSSETYSSRTPQTRGWDSPGRLHKPSQRNENFAQAPTSLPRKSAPQNDNGDSESEQSAVTDDDLHLMFARDLDYHFDNRRPTRREDQQKDVWAWHKPSRCYSRTVASTESESGNLPSNAEHSVWSIKLVPSSQGTVGVPLHRGQVKGPVDPTHEQNMPEWKSVKSLADRLEKIDLGQERWMSWDTMNRAMGDISVAGLETVKDPDLQLLRGHLQATSFVTISRTAPGTESKGRDPEESRYVWLTLAPAEI